MSASYDSASGGIESAELALTALSLRRPPFDPARSTFCSSVGSSSSSDSDSEPSVVQIRTTRRTRRGIRQGLLIDPSPSPFGACLLDTSPPPPSHPMAERATPSESEHEIQEMVPRPDPEYVYEALRSAWDSIKALAREYVPPLMRWLTGEQHPDRIAPIVPITLLAGLWLRPNWVWNTARFAALFAKGTARFYIVIIRDGPFGLFRQTVYLHVLSSR